MVISLENDSLLVQIRKKGAELFSVVNKANNLEYIWSGNPAFWGKTSPILFPIVGALKEDTYHYHQKAYKLTRHGFARDSDFDIESTEGTQKVSFLLKSSPETLLKYPFHFELRVTYEVIGFKLQISFAVKNIGNELMHFSIGAHPAFKVPLTSHTNYTDYFLEFNQVESENRWPIDSHGLIESQSVPFLTNARIINLTKELFYQDAIVLKNLKSNIISLKSHRHDHGIDFHFDHFKFLGLWAAKDADFICIEPWCGIADGVMHNQQFTQKEGIEKISPDESWSRTWHVTFF
jgi:galactose mutarotase-like enzyme